ncbi:hypothetical protein SISSUDRAFT_995550 [Sistotremastrum suecicum HHB10207 ss-3]|uniref:Uncharacterized protein n=1 Tax=Sistotremastrum suecicum HHB10207 ss-3 TaxID=1314776 RepID=A0A165WF12_9AGAM|nr:hypothetical protein SISSUDRAFT_995550 [Sistotremastrum suecicum HHB10207 ss-3]
MTSAESTKLALTIRAVVHAALRVVFEPLRIPSAEGAAIECGDKKIRVLHPGFAIASMDYEEAAVESLNRGVRARHPCGACHVETSEQHATGRHFPRRTISEMKAMLQEALAAKTLKAEKEILQKFGSYLLENAFWCLEHSNIYLALCYDILHSDDLGKLKKLFKLLKVHLNELGLGGALNEVFSTLPPYPGLKHFNSVTTIEYTDGNTMFHIMKVLKWKLDHPKRHALTHVFEDIKEKGSLINSSTRTGESMIQEIKASCYQTNGKDTDKGVGH